MIILHQGEDASARVQGVVAGIKGPIFISPDGSMEQCAQSLSAWLATTMDPALVVIDPALAKTGKQRDALRSIRRIAKFSGVDVHLVGDNRKLESVADHVVKVTGEPIKPPLPSDTGTVGPPAPADEIMLPFQRTEMDVPTVDELMALDGRSRAAAEERVKQLTDHEVWVNNLYQVNVEHGHGNDFAHVIIRRLDRQPVHNWQHFQQIKNELIGPECEAVELYPAESHLVDAKDHYHLWTFTSPQRSFGIGFRHGREVKPRK
jgi:hypothetical protein